MTQFLLLTARKHQGLLQLKWAFGVLEEEGANYVSTATVEPDVF